MSTIGLIGSRSPLNSSEKVGADIGHTQLMLDLRDLGYVLEGDGAEAVEADTFERVAVETEANRVVEEEADNMVMGDEAENEGLIRWSMVTVAEGCQVGGSFMDERVEGFGLAEGWQTRGRRADRDRGDEADVRQTMGSGLEMRAEGRHTVERALGEAEGGPLAAGSRARIMAENLTKSLGLGSSTVSEEGEAYEGKYKTEGSLALVADERQPVEVERSSDKVGGCERRNGRGLPIRGGLGSEEPLPLMADECQPAAVHESGGRADGGESESRGEVRAEADPVKGSSLERLMAEHGLLSAST